MTIECLKHNDWFMWGQKPRKTPHVECQKESHWSALKKSWPFSEVLQVSREVSFAECNFSRVSGCRSVTLLKVESIANTLFDFITKQLLLNRKFLQDNTLPNFTIFSNYRISLCHKRFHFKKARKLLLLKTHSKISNCEAFSDYTYFFSSCT